MKVCNVVAVSYCISCACHDLKACDAGCSWLRVDRDSARGVCSECPEHVKRWDEGDRSLVTPINDNQETIEKVVALAWSHSDKGANAEGYIAGALDMLVWLGELSDDQRFGLIASLNLPVPKLAPWVSEV